MAARATQEDTASATPARRTLSSDVVLMFGNKALLLLLNLVTSVVLARALGVEGRGELAVAISFSTILLQLGTFGLITANPYFVSRDPSRIAHVVANSLWFAVGLGTLLIAGGVLVKALFPAVVAGLSWTEVIVVLVGIPAALATVFLQSVLLGEGRTIAYNAVEIGHGVLVTAALAVALFVFDAGVLDALAIYSAFYVVAALVYVALLMRHAPPFSKPDSGLARTMLKYAFRVYVATLIAFLVIRVDLLLVNTYLGPVEAGLYSVVAALAEGMYLLPVVVGVNLFPRIASGAGLDLSATVFRTMSVFYGILCLVSVPLVGPFIELLYGPQFAGATDLYYWIVPGIYSLGMLTILSNHFAGRGYPLSAMMVWFVGLAINLAMNFLLLKDYGTYIASLASSVAYGVLLVLHMRLFAKESGGYGVFRPRPRELVTILKAALGRRPAGSEGSAGNA